MQLRYEMYKANEVTLYNLKANILSDTECINTISYSLT
jgi:hypothetical protein